MKDALVVGGGYAGVACAFALADAGVPVTLLEARRAWGGRATSWPDPKMGDPVDNGQHVWLGCYDDAFALLKRLGTDRHVPLAGGLDLCFLEPGGRAHRLSAPPALGRAGLALALLRYGALSPAGRWRLARALRSAEPPMDSETALDWLDRAGQGPAEVRAFWDPLVLSALNVPLDVASARLVHAVVVAAFRGTPLDATIGVPRAGLAELLLPVPDALAACGGRARLGAAVRRVTAAPLGGYRLALEGDETLEATALVLAVPAADARELVALGLPDVAARLEAAAETKVSPIVTVTLWFDAPVLPSPVTGLLAPRGGSPPAFQWAFDRAHHVAGTSGTWPIALVASAADDIATRPTAELLGLATATLAAYGITTRAPLAGRVVKEPRATPVFDPASDRFRPAVDGGRAGLAFAGDWTATGLPATLEGAVRSGRAAAHHLLASGILNP